MNEYRRLFNLAVKEIGEAKIKYAVEASDVGIFLIKAPEGWGIANHRYKAYESFFIHKMRDTQEINFAHYFKIERS